MASNDVNSEGGITVPAFSLVVLVGPTSAGKSSFAERHFRPTEVVSSDVCRGLVADDETAMDANDDAFALLHTIVAMRLKRRLLTVVDATNLQPEARRPLLALARRNACPAAAIVFDVDERTLTERNLARAHRNLPPSVVRTHVARMRRSLWAIDGEGFEQVVVLRSADEIDAARVERRP